MSTTKNLHQRIIIIIIINSHSKINLKHLNIILAAATQDCPCSTVAAEDKAAYMQFATAELEKIRLRQVDLCGGTGKDYPAFGSLQYGLNVFSKAQLITDRRDREGY